MSCEQESIPTGSECDPQRERSGFRPKQLLHASVDWLVAGPVAQPPDIQNQLLHQSLTKTKALVIGVASSSLLAFVAAVTTAAVWAYAWLLAELLFVGIRLALMNSLATAQASGNNGKTIARILIGLTVTTVLSVGAYQCVASGQWLLISMSGIAVASLIGAISSRNAGTPRYAFILVCVLTAPFSLACLISPIPYLFMVGLQLPLYACGVVLVMLQNYKVLLNLCCSERENRRLAENDPLTGLPNRIMNLKRFDELLAGPPAMSDQMQNELTVFCLDLDGFKDVNDSYGHAAGDALLIALADRLRDSVRTVDFVSRIGGDEFVILLPAISPAEAADIAKRIIARVGVPFDIGLQAPVHVGISIGSACAPDDGKTADALLRSADRALYEVKRRGKGLFVAHNTLEVEAVELDPVPDASILPADEARSMRRTADKRSPKALARHATLTLTAIPGQS